MTADEYEAAAWEYYRTLPLEHFMESTRQSPQKKTAMVGFDLLALLRGDLQHFSELLVQYFFGDKLCRVVPDNMLVITSEPMRERSNYAIELEPEPPFMMLEWVSDSSEDKDYVDTFRKYEQELRVPYCLFFHLEKRDLAVYQHNGQHYVKLEPNLDGRIEIPELELEIGLLDGWARFWYQGKLLEVPTELKQQLNERDEQVRSQSEQLNRQTEQIDRQSEQIDRQTEQIRRQTDELNSVRDMLRDQVKSRAIDAGRQDILDALEGADLSTIMRWWNELK
jgi:Uma2 family endonuclease